MKYYKYSYKEKIIPIRFVLLIVIVLFLPLEISSPNGLLIDIPLLILMFILHEVLHAVGFRFFGKAKSKNITYGVNLEKGVFYCTCKEEISKKGILISLWIFYTAYKIFIDSYDVLMDKAISNETREEVYKVIKKYKDIKKVTHFNATPVGYQYQISFTIFVDGKMSTFDSHKIANDLEKEIGNKFPEIYYQFPPVLICQAMS